MSVETSNTVNDPVREDGDKIAPSEADEPQNSEGSSLDCAESDNTLNEPAREDRGQLIPPFYQSETEGGHKHQLNNVNQLRISIGALMVLVVLAAGLAVFYPRQREVAVLGGGHVESLSGANTAAAPTMPVDDVRNETMVEERSQLELASLSPSLPVPEDSDQNRDTPKKQNIVEVGKSATTTRPATQEIYRISGPSFLRNRPTAEAEIIETLRPGSRVAVTSRSGEYYLVRSLDDKTVSGFVHREDAFFERMN